MVGPDDVISWKDLATGGAVIISGGVALIVKQFTRRLDDHEKKDDETFTALFRDHAEVKQLIADGFRGIDADINAKHIKLLERISDIQQVADYTGTERRHSDRT